MIEIIPAIDIIGGKCVRLSQGDYATSKSYYEDPADVAAMFADAGLRRLHMVDLDGARSDAPANLGVLERVVARTGMKVQYGGGIKSRDSLAALFSAGAAMAICGSVAVTRPEEVRQWLGEFGGGRIILGADVRGVLVAMHGWMKQTSVSIYKVVTDFLDAGLSQLICTDISRDGMFTGTAVGLYVDLMERFPDLTVIASGGVGSMDDIAALERAGVPSVIVGKAIYEGHITIKDLELCLQKG